MISRPFFGARPGSWARFIAGTSGGRVGYRNPGFPPGYGTLTHGSLVLRPGYILTEISIDGLLPPTMRVGVFLNPAGPPVGSIDAFELGVTSSVGAFPTIFTTAPATRTFVSSGVRYWEWSASPIFLFGGAAYELFIY